MTGLRFTKKKRIIHMQIQQGKLLAKGKIDKDSVEWVPVEEYEITNVTKENGKDFHTFTYEERSIDLDDLKAVKNHVVTGKTKNFQICLHIPKIKMKQRKTYPTIKLI